jgi:hypothetical protein
MPPLGWRSRHAIVSDSRRSDPPVRPNRGAPAKIFCSAILEDNLGGTLAAELRPDIQAAKDRLRIRLGVGRKGTITIYASGNKAKVENVNNDEPARTSSR